MRIGLLISGDLGHHILNHINELNIIFVLTDKNSIKIIEFCKKNSMNFFVGNPRNTEINSFIYNIKVDVIISVNYLFIVENNILNIASIIAFNIHGSILPKYRGRTPHVWAIINGEKEIGVTAHEMTLECDEGDILKQDIFKLDDNETGASILKKFTEIYPRIIDSVINDIYNGTLTKTKQDQSKATYFPKRTPNDGIINWNWDMIKIRNWVRAQSYPYPGAFSYINEDRIIIDKVSVLKIYTDENIQNGTILNHNNRLIVKVSDGFLSLDKIRNNLKIKPNTKFKNDN